MNKRYDGRLLTILMIGFALIGAAFIFTVKANAPLWTLILAMFGSAILERFGHE